jgi:hypothetical protein
MPSWLHGIIPSYFSQFFLALTNFRAGQLPNTAKREIALANKGLDPGVQTARWIYHGARYDDVTSSNR